MGTTACSEKEHSYFTEILEQYRLLKTITQKNEKIQVMENPENHSLVIVRTFASEDENELRDIGRGIHLIYIENEIYIYIYLFIFYLSLIEE